MLKKNIALLDIILMLASALLAVYLPFKLFLFSYAILGPLHYLTEINWLKEHNLFIKKFEKWHLLFFLSIAGIISLYPILNLLKIETTFINNLFIYLSSHTNTLIIGAFLFAICLVFLKKAKNIMYSLIISILLAYGFSYLLPNYAFVLGLFMLTIIHVYLFTLIFVINGAFKNRKLLSVLGTVLLIGLPLLLFGVTIKAENYTITKENITSINQSGLQFLNYYISRIFSSTVAYDDLLNSIIGIKIQIFIAFVYTYHYLNWFIKTSIIGWKKTITNKKMILILGVWILSISIYSYDYYTGYVVLLFLSVVHVLLEFPLNIKSLELLLKNIKSLIKS